MKLQNKQNVRSRIRQWNWTFIVLFALMLLICAVHALDAAEYVDFYAINGDFQNFNPVRRLLAGQVPYRDFQDYLGLGHLYTGSILTWLFGGNFQASLFAFSFLSFLSIGLIFMAVGFVLLKKKENAAAVSNIFLLLLLIQSPIMNVIVGDTYIINAMNYALSAGNSARFIRGMILPITILAAMGILNGRKSDVTASGRRINKETAAVMGIGILAGASFVWSNDYGIGCWLCLILMTCIVLISRRTPWKKTILLLLIEIIISFASIFIVIEILTLGHFSGWLTATFGTGGYQSWYYEVYAVNKSYYIFDIDVSYLTLTQAAICLWYLYKLFITRGTKESIRRYGYLGYANMTAFCVVNEYRVLSGGSSREVAYSVLFATVMFELFRFIAVNSKSSRSLLRKNKKNLVVISMMLSIVWSLSNIQAHLKTQVTGKGGVYIEALGGYITSLGKALKRTNSFLDGKTVFSTYASAQEVISGHFQPSGTDYIIHVLGDDAREDYLKCFEEGNFDYAATIQKKYTNWEYWVERANWFFYRELYANYHPVYGNSYELYWEKNDAGETHVVEGDFTVEIKSDSNGKKRLVIKTDSDINGVADIYIDYNVEKDGSASSKLVYREMINVRNTGSVTCEESYYEANNLRPSGSEYVPMTIIDGYGELTLNSYPSNDTILTVNEASCDRIFTAVVDYEAEK